MKHDFLSVPRNIITALEANSVPLTNFFLTFFFAVMFRHYAESYSQVANYLNLPLYYLDADIVHFALSYVTLALLFILLFHTATKTPLEQVIKPVLAGFILLLLTPLLDLIFTQGFGASILYMQPVYNINLVHAYLTIGGGFQGVSLGIKCEVVVALIASMGYLLVKNTGILLSIFYTWATYTLIFLWGASPYLIKWVLEGIGLTYAFSPVLMLDFYLMMIFILSVFIIYCADKSFLATLIKGANFQYYIYYLLMLLLGVSIAVAHSPGTLAAQLHLQQEVIANVILTSMSLALILLFAHQLRLLATGVVRDAAKQPFAITYSSLAAGLFYAIMVNGKVFLTMAVFAGTFYVYYMLPFRIQRLVLLSKIIVSINSIVLIVLGYVLVQFGIYEFYWGLFLIYVIGVTLAANVLDIDNHQSDVAAGLVTMPSLLGDKTAKIMIGAAFWLIYIAFYYVLRATSILPALILLGGVQFYLINKKHYHASSVIGLVNASVCMLILYLWIHKGFFQ